MTVRILLLAVMITLANTSSRLTAQDNKSVAPPGTLVITGKPEPGRGLESKPMKPTRDEIAKWMNDYFTEYNASAQDAKTAHKMDTYLAPNFTFIPYMYVFGGPEGAITGRDAFLSMLTGHPSDYEKFKVLDVFIDAERLVAVAFLEATIYETATNKIKVRKNYLPLYELMLDDKGTLKIATIRFFWQALPPEIDGAAYAVDKTKWGKH